MSHESKIAVRNILEDLEGFSALESSYILDEVKNKLNNK